jgi:DNA-binding MarR family transcriptional regulator
MAVETVEDLGTRELVDALLGASRALVAVAVRSLSSAEEEVTMPQYRTLVLLCSRGPQRVADLAEALGVSPPNATRMCARLVRKGLIRRSRSASDRRSVRVSVTPSGRQLVSQVGTARRHELTRIVDQMPRGGRLALVEVLRGFSCAAGEVPEHGWDLGWGQDGSQP